MTNTAELPGLLTDEDIVGRVIEGEKELYEIIVRRHNQKLFRIARAYVKDNAEAEDVVQQAYINAYEHLRGYEKRSKFSTWLVRILINESLRRLKHQERFMDVEAAGEENGHVFDPASGPGENPAEKVMNEELRTILERTIDALPARYRSVFVMREVDGMSTAETSEVLGITTTNVKVRLNRAKEMLKESIGSAYRDAQVYHFDLERCDRIVAQVLGAVKRY